LVDGFSQVGDLNAYGVARYVMIKVHVEEVAGHRRAIPWECHAAPTPGKTH
jgi:hypothetical protein